HATRTRCVLVERAALNVDSPDELAVAQPAPLAYRDDAVHKDARSDDRLGVERAQPDDLVDLGDRGRRRRGHDRPEVAGSLAEDQIAPAVGLERADEREIRTDRILEQVGLALDLADLLALGELRADGGGRVEGADAGAGR